MADEPHGLSGGAERNGRRRKYAKPFTPVQVKGVPWIRNEQFYTCTVLPSLLFHNGLANFFAFLRLLDGMPLQINEQATGRSFVFFTEYNYKRATSMEDPDVSEATTAETPDVLVYLHAPVRVLVCLEGKMYQCPNGRALERQIGKQKQAVLAPLARRLQAAQQLQVALVPRDSGLVGGEGYQVVYWEQLLDQPFAVGDNLFSDYLRFALDHYESLVEKRGGLAGTATGKMRGWEIRRRAERGERFWFGREGGKKVIHSDLHSGGFDRREYHINDVSEVRPRERGRDNWISTRDFLEMVRKASDCEQQIVRMIEDRHVISLELLLKRVTAALEEARSGQ